LISTFRPSVAPPLPSEMLNLPRKEMPPLILKGFLPPVFLIALIKCSILFGWATPSEAGAVGAFGAFVLAAFYGTLKWPMLRSVCHTSANTIAMVFFIIITATCFAYVFRSLGGDDFIKDVIYSVGVNPWGILGILMAVTFFLGFFFDWIEITLIVLPVFAPILAGLDFGDHVPKLEVVYWFSILMAVNLQTSFLTPPFGFALFYMKGVAPPEVRIQQIYRGIIPFVILQLIGLGLVIAFPEIAMWLPRTVLE
jgi:tripartite ATP-independent transporter DctM subunit